MAEMEEVEHDSKLNANNVTMDTLFHQSPIMNNTKGEIADVTSERQISSDILAETIKVFNRLTLLSTIKDSADYHSEKNDAERDTKSDQVVATHTSDGKKRKVTDTDATNVNFPHKLLINRIIPDIIPVVIPPVHQTTADGVAASGETLHAVRTFLSKKIVTDAACSAAHVFKDPLVVNWKDTDGAIPRDRNTFGMPPRATTPVRIGTVPLVSPTSIRSQDIGSPRRSIGPQEVSNVQPFETSHNGISSKHRDPTPTWSNVISRKLSDESSSDIYFHCRMNLVRDTVLTKSSNFMNLWLSSVQTSYELVFVFIPTTRIGRPADGSNWLSPGHYIGEVTADRVSGTRT